ncbi:hypothetical protein BDZ85DRAFT_74613 [Elsinoe ampelina]|uniref:Uncharacterized protein n=1 Tax=Elsinoe ampelina TaxID=302913 RepID=A0A6A6GJW1_9PEZI|nr:hypothetical protein BDZ85DRAFT_74613 [Elsinoe ampelina]
MQSLTSPPSTISHRTDLSVYPARPCWKFLLSSSTVITNICLSSPSFSGGSAAECRIHATDASNSGRRWLAFVFSLVLITAEDSYGEATMNLGSVTKSQKAYEGGGVK